MTTVVNTGPDGVELAIAHQLARKGAVVLPIVVIAATIARGWPGALGAALGCGLVVANFYLGAALLTWGARISADTLLGAALFGYLIRMALILVAGFAVKSWGYPDMPAFLYTVLATHLVLLFWEVKSVSATLKQSAPIASKE